MARRDVRPLAQVTRQPLHRQVQEAIRAYIVDNQLVAGDQLPPEGRLAELLGISRNSVREGVKALEVQGVIEARVGAGLFVRAFSFEPILEGLPYGLLVGLESVSHLLRLREVLDLGAVEHLIESVSEDQVANLQSILDEWRVAAEKGVYPAQLDRDFHQALYAELDNPLLPRLAGLFWDIYRQVTDNSDVPDVEDPKHTQRLHREILEGLIARDPSRLRAAIKDHYPGIWSGLL